MDIASLFESLEDRKLFAVGLAKPTVLKVTGTSTSAVVLHWNDNATKEQGYQIFKSIDGVNFKLINTIGPNITTYVNGKLITGTHYWFRVRAYNKTGVSLFSNTAEGIPLTPVVTPPPPVGIGDPTGLKAAAASSTEIDVTWTDNSKVETGYKIDRSTDGVNFTHLPNLPANTTKFNDTSLAAATTYYYRVRAFNATSNSHFSNVASAITQTPPPLVAPDGLQTTALTASAIKITWIDHSTSELGYKIERSTDNKSFTQIGTVPTDTTLYVSTGLKPSTRYYYRIRAYDATTNSAYSNTVSRTTKSVPDGANHDWANGGVGPYANSLGNWFFDGVTITLAADPAQTIPLLKEAHVGSIRTFFSKSASWDPKVSNGDDGYANAKAYHDAGFRVLMVVGDDQVPTYDQAKAFFDYVGAKPGLLNVVDAFEIGNEPNRPNFWKGTAQQYIDVNLKPAWDALHPLGATIVGAGPTFDVNYAKTLVTDGYLNYCDIADFHPYGDSPDQVYQRAIGAIAAYQGKPTMFTEWNIRNEAGLDTWAAKVDAARILLATTGADSAFYFTAFVANTLGGAAGLLNLADFSPNEPFFDMYKNWGENTAPPPQPPPV